LVRGMLRRPGGDIGGGNGRLRGLACRPGLAPFLFALLVFQALLLAPLGRFLLLFFAALLGVLPTGVLAALGLALARGGSRLGTLAAATVAAIALAAVAIALSIAFGAGGGGGGGLGHGLVAQEQGLQAGEEAARCDRLGGRRGRRRGRGRRFRRLADRRRRGRAH